MYLRREKEIENEIELLEREIEEEYEKLKGRHFSHMSLIANSLFYKCFKLQQLESELKKLRSRIGKRR